MSAIAKRPDAYEHVDARRRRQRHPLRRVRAGGQVDARSSRPRSSASSSTARRSTDVVDTLKQLEHEGYHFEAADGSLELLMRRATGLGAGLLRGRVVPGHHRRQPADDRGGVDHRGDDQGARRRRAASSRPPRATARSTPSTPRCATAIGERYPALDRVHLTDYKVRVLDTQQGHRRGHPGAASTRTDGERVVDDDRRVSENIIEASWQALSDSIVFGLLHNRA